MPAASSSFQRLGSLSPAARSKLSLAIFFIGLGISIASCAGYSINYIPPTYQFGLFQMLPSLFWFGFALCLVSVIWGIKRDGERTFIIKSMLLCLLMWNIPTLLLKNLYAPGSYMHVFEAMPIMLSGHVPVISETLPVVFKYYPAEFPGFHIMLASIFEITNVPVITFAKFYPIFSSLVTFLAILLFFKTFLPSVNYRWALLISVLANVYMQLHVSPQSVGLVAGILILVALEKPGLRWKSIAILLFAFVVVSHPTTAFILLPIVVLAWLLRAALRRDVRALVDLAPVFVAMWLAWMLVHAASLGQTMIGLATAPTGAVQGTGIFFLDSVTGAAGERLEGIFYLAPRIRLGVLALFGLGSAYYLVTQWFSRVGRKDRNLVIYTAFIIAPVVMTVIDVTFAKIYYGLHDRYFLFFLLASPILLVMLAERSGLVPASLSVQEGCFVRVRGAAAKWRRDLGGKGFLSVLILLALFNFTTTYYQSSLLVHSDQTVYASDFVNSKCSSSQVIGWWIIPDLDDPYASAIVRRIPLYRIYPQRLTELEEPSVVVFDDHDKMWYQVRYGIETYDFYANADELEDSLNKVYSNDKYDIYWFEGKEGW